MQYGITFHWLIDACC